jgi:hypothetical protein
MAVSALILLFLVLPLPFASQLRTALKVGDWAQYEEIVSFKGYPEVRITRRLLAFGRAGMQAK